MHWRWRRDCHVGRGFTTGPSSWAAGRRPLSRPSRRVLVLVDGGPLGFALAVAPSSSAAGASSSPGSPSVSAPSSSESSSSAPPASSTPASAIAASPASASAPSPSASPASPARAGVLVVVAVARRVLGLLFINRWFSIVPGRLGVDLDGSLGDGLFIVLFAPTCARARERAHVGVESAVRLDAQGSIESAGNPAPPPAPTHRVALVDGVGRADRAVRSVLGALIALTTGRLAASSSSSSSSSSPPGPRLATCAQSTQSPRHARRGTVVKRGRVRVVSSAMASSPTVPTSAAISAMLSPTSQQASCRPRPLRAPRPGRSGVARRRRSSRCRPPPSRSSARRRRDADACGLCAIGAPARLRHRRRRRLDDGRAHHRRRARPRRRAGVAAPSVAPTVASRAMPTGSASAAVGSASLASSATARAPHRPPRAVLRAKTGERERDARGGDARPRAETRLRGTRALARSPRRHGRARQRRIRSRRPRQARRPSARHPRRLADIVRACRPRRPHRWRPGAAASGSSIGARPSTCCCSSSSPICARFGGVGRQLAHSSGADRNARRGRAGASSSSSSSSIWIFVGRENGAT